MADRQTLLYLAKRCEEAPRPSYEINCGIADAIGYKDIGQTIVMVDPFGKSDAKEIRRCLPNWTGSLDAAMTLVPKVEYVCIQHYSDGWYIVFCQHSTAAKDAPGRSDQAKTLAGGICAAALRALAAMEPGS